MFYAFTFVLCNKDLLTYLTLIRVHFVTLRSIDRFALWVDRAGELDDRSLVPPLTDRAARSTEKNSVVDRRTTVVHNIDTITLCFTSDAERWLLCELCTSSVDSDAIGRGWRQQRSAIHRQRKSVDSATYSPRMIYFCCI